MIMRGRSHWRSVAGAEVVAGAGFSLSPRLTRTTVGHAHAQAQRLNLALALMTAAFLLNVAILVSGDIAPGLPITVAIVLAAAGVSLVVGAVDGMNEHETERLRRQAMSRPIDRVKDYLDQRGVDYEVVALLAGRGSQISARSSTVEQGRTARSPHSNRGAPRERRRPERRRRLLRVAAGVLSLARKNLFEQPLRFSFSILGVSASR